MLRLPVARAGPGRLRRLSFTVSLRRPLAAWQRGRPGRGQPGLQAFGWPRVRVISSGSDDHTAAGSAATISASLSSPGRAAATVTQAAVAAAAALVAAAGPAQGLCPARLSETRPARGHGL